MTRADDTNPAEEERLLRQTAMRNVKSILQARQRAEDALVHAKEQLERRADELARSLSTLRATLESTTDGILVVDTDGAIVDHNAKLLQLLDVSRERIATLGRADLLWRELGAQSSAWERLQTRLGQIATGTTESIDQIELDGERMLELFSIEQRLDGQVIGRVWSFRDITERRRQDAALRASEERVRATFDQAAVGMAVATLDGRFELVNRRFGQILGYPIDEIHGGSIVDFTHPDDRDATRENVERLLAGDIGEYQLEKRYLRKDGSSVWSRTSVTLLRDTTGEPRRFVGVVEDISERKQVEDRERAGAVRLHLALSAGRLGDWSWDATSDLISLGQRAAQIFGFAGTAEVTWTALEARLHPDDRARVRQALDTAVLERSDYEIDYRVQNERGHDTWIAATGRGVYSPQGEIVGAIGVVQDITERRKLETLRHHLAAVVASSDDAILSTDLEGVILTWNAGARRIFSYAPEEVVGQPVTILVPPELRAQEESVLQRQRRGESIDHYETVRLAKNGDRIDVSLTVSPIRDASGIVGVSKVARDIRGRKRADEKLRRREEELRALADSIPQLAWMAHPDGHIFWYNRGWYDYTGTSLEEMQGWGWRSVHDPNVLPQVVERWEASLRSGEAFEMEFPLRGADGTFRWFLTRIRPIRDAAGRVSRWFGTNTDVDEVKRTREALREETRVLNLLHETGKSIAAGLDLETLVKEVTDAGTQLSGADFGAFFYNRTDANGESYQLFALSGAERADFEKFGHPRSTPLFATTFTGGPPLRIDDVSLDPRYGQWGGMPQGHLPVRSYLAVPVISRTGEVIGGLFFAHCQPGIFTARIERIISGMAAQAAVAFDNARLYESVKSAADERQRLLEAERRARAEAERISITKDEFLATLSHELRTPLNAIVGWSQVLRMRGNTDPEVLEGLEVIDRNAKAQAQLIEDLLDMSRIISGKVRLDVQQVDLPDVVKAAIASVRHAADAKGIRLRVVLDPLVGPVLGDPGRLQQCFWNLLANAIKFTARGGHVQVSLARVNSHVEFSVVDDGAGIAPEFLPHLFERFRQADASSTRSHSGLGLGLSIVKSFVELHGGSVSARSAGEGKGAAFRVELPLVVVGSTPEGGPREHPRAPVHHDTATDHPSLAGITVLVVDDEADARDLLKRVLDSCHAKAWVAASAREGLEILRRERPDVLISDLGMPEEDGFTFIRKVRLLPPTEGGRIPAAALSAFARSEDRTRALRAGFQVHLAKPVQPTELTAMIASLALRP